MNKALTIKKTKEIPAKINYNDQIPYLVMSLNNTRFEDTEILKEIIQWMQQKTSCFVLLIGDHLHRLNYMIFENLSEEDSIRKAKKRGDYLSNIFDKSISEVASKNGNICYSPKRLKEFYSTKDFCERFKRFETHLQANPIFKDSIDSIISTYIGRQAKKPDSIEKAYQLSRKYLLEELVIFELLAEKGLTINIYPGSQLPVMKAIVKNELPGISPSLEKISLVEIVFKPKNK